MYIKALEGGAAGTV